MFPLRRYSDGCKIFVDIMTEDMSSIEVVISTVIIGQFVHTGGGEGMG